MISPSGGSVAKGSGRIGKGAGPKKLVPKTPEPRSS